MFEWWNVESTEVEKIVTLNNFSVYCCGKWLGSVHRAYICHRTLYIRCSKTTPWRQRKKSVQIFGGGAPTRRDGRRRRRDDDDDGKKNREEEEEEEKKRSTVKQTLKAPLLPLHSKRRTQKYVPRRLPVQARPKTTPLRKPSNNKMASAK